VALRHKFEANIEIRGKPGFVLNFDVMRKANHGKMQRKF